MTTTSIEIVGSQIVVSSPYNKDFVSGAKRCGGKFSPTDSAWLFDARDEERVRSLCLECYGTDGHTQSLVTLRVEYKERESARGESIALAGRSIARATGRDSGARPCDGVILLAGGFVSGGSVKNWTTEVRAGTIILVRDFPKAAAEALIAESDAKTVYSIEIEERPIDPAALRAERAGLVERLAEIDAALVRAGVKS